MTNIETRWMIHRHMDCVLDIERRSFEFPWSESDFVKLLRNRNAIGKVAEVDGVIVGFMVYELFDHHLHVPNFAVHPEWRRIGVGRALLDSLIKKLSLLRRSRIVLEVRETNIDAQFFFRSIGFRAVNILRDFYEDTTEDAYVMSYRHVPSDEERAAALAMGAAS